MIVGAIIAGSVVVALAWGAILFFVRARERALIDERRHDKRKQ